MARCIAFDDFDGMFLTKQPGQIALSRADTTNQTDYRNPSRSILHAESRCVRRREAVDRLGVWERNKSRPAAVVTLYDADPILVSQGQNGKSVLAGSGRIEHLQRRRLDQVLHSRPILLHAGSNEMGLERRQIAPFLDDREDIRTWSRLSGNTADSVYRRAVFQTPRFGPHFRDQSPKFLQKRFASAIGKFNRRDHVNHVRDSLQVYRGWRAST